MTQFATVDRVNFKLEGKPVTVFLSEEIVLDKPVTRATYRDRYLPLIFVDWPAWGAALLNPGPVTGLANVFEGQFRIAVLDRNDKVLVDAPVRASCGTGCWGEFDLTLSYDVSSVPVGNAPGVGHLGVQRQAGRGARVSRLPAVGALRRSRPRTGTRARHPRVGAPRWEGRCVS